MNFPGVPIDHPARDALADAIRKLDAQALIRAPYIICRLLPEAKLILGDYFARSPRPPFHADALFVDPICGAWTDVAEDLFNQHGLVALASHVLRLESHEAAMVVGHLALEADTIMEAMLAKRQ